MTNPTEDVAYITLRVSGDISIPIMRSSAEMFIGRKLLKAPKGIEGTITIAPNAIFHHNEVELLLLAINNAQSIMEEVRHYARERDY